MAHAKPMPGKLNALLSDMSVTVRIEVLLLMLAIGVW